MAVTRIRWLEDVVRPLLVAALITCIAASWVGLVNRSATGADAGYLTPLCFLVAIEAFISRRLIRTRLHRLDNAKKYRAAELFVLYFLVQVIGNVAAGRSNPLAGIPNADAGNFLSFVLLLGCWVGATLTAGDLEALDQPAQNYPGYIQPAESLTKRFFAGALLLLFAAGLSRVEIATLVNLSNPAVPGLVLNVLIYFVLGMVMLGQIQYSTLTQRWRQQDTRISEGLAGRWVRLSAVLLVIVAAIAFVLPTGHTIGLLDLLAYGLSAIGFGLSLLLSVLIIAPLLWLLGLFGWNPGAEDEPIQAQPPEFPPPSAAGGGGDWFEILRSIFFWGLLLLIFLYMVRSYLRNQPGIARAIRNLGLVRLAGRLWLALRRRLRGYARAVATHLPHRPARRPGAGVATSIGRIFRRPGELSAREQVLYYYLDTIHRARETGHPRRPHQTPREYGDALGSSLPEEGRPDMDDLTDAFVVARYSPHPVETEDAGRARTRWQRLGDALKGLRRE